MPSSRKPAPRVVLPMRQGVAVAQALVRLFSAGAVIYEAHRLLLRYYANEWAGIQYAGVNGCAGEERIANGDLIGGVTLCNKPINFMPWVELYRRHWQAALFYYSVAALIILLIGLALNILQRRLGSTTPFGGSRVSPPPADSEHLR